MIAPLGSGGVPWFVQVSVLEGRAPGGGADANPAFMRLIGVCASAGIRERLLCGGNAERTLTRQMTPQVRVGNARARIKVTHHPRDADRKRRRIEVGDRSHAAAAGHER